MDPIILEIEAPEWLEAALDLTFDVDEDDDADDRAGTLGYF